ncbi:hypothetical protein GN956_G7552 [Arapaima gigas]
MGWEVMVEQVRPIQENHCVQAGSCVRLSSTALKVQAQIIPLTDLSIKTLQGSRTSPSPLCQKSNQAGCTWIMPDLSGVTCVSKATGWSRLQSRP